MISSNPARLRAIGFLGLDPEIRNHIYELVYSHHKRTAKSVTISSEKGYREVPADFSRACRQIRRETLEYFYDLDLVTFAIRNPSDLSACREWLQFAPESAWAMVKAIRMNHLHKSATSTLPCSLHFELALDKVEAPVSFWGDRQLECGICYDKNGPTSLVSTIDLILKDMCGSGRISRPGLELIFEMLEQATSDGG